MWGYGGWGGGGAEDNSMTSTHSVQITIRLQILLKFLGDWFVAGSTAAAAGTAASLKHPLAAGFLDLLREGYAISVWAKTNDIKKRKQQQQKVSTKAHRAQNPPVWKQTFGANHPPKLATFQFSCKFTTIFACFFSRACFPNRKRQWDDPQNNDLTIPTTATWSREPVTTQRQERPV